MNSQASKVFLTSDLCENRYLCFLVESHQHLRSAGKQFIFCIKSAAQASKYTSNSLSSWKYKKYQHIGNKQAQKPKTKLNWTAFFNLSFCYPNFRLAVKHLFTSLQDAVYVFTDVWSLLRATTPLSSSLPLLPPSPPKMQNLCRYTMISLAIRLHTVTKVRDNTFLIMNHNTVHSALL